MKDEQHDEGKVTSQKTQILSNSDNKYCNLSNNNPNI